MKRYAILLGVVAASFTVVLGAGQATAGGKTLVVDNDKQQCPQAKYTSISAAIAAAAPGDKIKVCPGLYNETVVVNKPGLTLQGSTNGSTTEPCLRGDDAANPAQDSVVNGQVRLEADGVSLDAFTVQFNPAPPDDTGVWTNPAYSGYSITRNVIQNNSGGLNLNAGGAQPTLVQNNCLRSNNQNAPAGLSEVGIFSEQGALHNARIVSNTFTGQTFGSMFLGYGLEAFPTITAPSTDITVAHNVLVDDGAFGVFLNNVSGIDIADNKIIRLEEGILVFPPASNVVVEHNDVEDNGFYSIRVDGDPFGCCVYPSGPTNVTVAHNHVLRSGSVGPRDGILLFATSGQTVVDNDIQNSYRDGISIRAGSTGNLVSGNHVEGSGRDGIRNRDTSSGNTYRDNHLKNNAEFDAYDQNWPANTWVGNHCDTDFPAGTICGVK